MDLKQLQYFVACAQAGSFSDAAKILYSTQPSVSKVIKACIFYFTRRIRRSVVRCMQCRKKETEADRDWYTNVRSIVKMRRFCIRNI